ncbi:RNA-directed DNA polymerase, eukaryota, reverse transcriptase zinc-binding domain protein [Tanacetum coccineum]
MNIHASMQSMFNFVEVLNTKFFLTIVYASNNGRERQKLWEELKRQSNFSQNRPWIIMGDFNVTLNSDEHSAGSAYATNEMKEFQYCVNDIEVNDLRRTGFHFTWTKNKKRPFRFAKFIADKDEFLSVVRDN